jgi:hypothetical protein
MRQKIMKLLDQAREGLPLKDNSYRTEQSYLDWIRPYILFHHKELAGPEIQAFMPLSRSAGSIRVTNRPALDLVKIQGEWKAAVSKCQEGALKVCRIMFIETRRLIGKKWKNALKNQRLSA